MKAGFRLELAGGVRQGDVDLCWWSYGGCAMEGVGCGAAWRWNWRCNAVFDGTVSDPSQRHVGHKVGGAVMRLGFGVNGCLVEQSSQSPAHRLLDPRENERK